MSDRMRGSGGGCDEGAPLRDFAPLDVRVDTEGELDAATRGTADG